MMRHMLTSQWETVQVIPLGDLWENVYLIDDEVHLSRCPGWLIQERRAVVSDDESVEWMEAPFETRVIYGEIDGPLIVPVDEAENYIDTITPDAGMRPDYRREHAEQIADVWRKTRQRARMKIAGA